MLVLHGFGMSARVWDPIARALAPRRVLAPDARGHGDSGRGPETRDWYATGPADLEALVEGLGVERLALVGHSMGANVAMRFAAAHPDRVERLVLLDAGPDLPAAVTSTRRARPIPKRTPPLSGFESERAYARALEVIHPRARPEALLALAGHWLRQRPDGRFEPKLDPELARVERGEHGPDGAWAREESDRLWGQLGAARCPVLVVRGELSTVLPASTARRMVAVSHDASLVELAGAGHALMLDAAEQLAALLDDFLT